MIKSEKWKEIASRTSHLPDVLMRCAEKSVQGHPSFPRAHSRNLWRLRAITLSSLWESTRWRRYEIIRRLPTFGLGPALRPSLLRVRWLPLALRWVASSPLMPGGLLTGPRLLLSKLPGSENSAVQLGREGIPGSGPSRSQQRSRERVGVLA